MAFMPVRLRLKDSRGLYHLRIIQRPADKLNSHWQSNVIKSTRHADSRQPADIPNASDGIGERKRLIQIRIQFARRQGKAGGGQNVHAREQVGHLFLQDSADALGDHMVGSADGLIHISAYLAQWIVKLTYFAGLDQLAKRSSAFNG